MVSEDAPACSPPPAGGAAENAQAPSPSAAGGPAGGFEGPPRRAVSGLVTPLRVELQVLPPEEIDEEVRVTFWVNVRDARGGRCPDLAVEARIHGPERTGEGMVWTDQYGQAQFRMRGPRGTYRCEVLDVGAGGVALAHRDSDTVVTAAHLTV